MRFTTWLIICIAASWASVAAADSLSILVYKIIPNKNISQVNLGTITATDSPFGLLLIPDLNTLPPGIHGMDIDEHPSCAKSGLAAGGHWDPQHTGHHLGPYGFGHLGDLPALTVTNNGDANLPVLAPRLKVKDLQGHSLIIHAGGDTYSDQPPLGGSGARIACAVIEKK